MSRNKHKVTYKKLFTTTAIATVAIVVPTMTVGAEEATVTTTNFGVVDIIAKNPQQKINYSLDVNLASITDLVIIEKYEWFYVEGGTELPILGATSSSLKVPLEALGKMIRVKVTSQQIDASGKHLKDGNGNDLKKIYSGDYAVTSISIFIDPITVLGVSVENGATVGDMITIGPIILKDGDPAGVELPFDNNQVQYQFQWYEKVGSSYSLVQGATARSLTITQPLDKKQLVAKVSFEVNGEKYSQFTTIADLNESNATSGLDSNIIGLTSIGDNFQEIYATSNLELFKIHIAELMNEYNLLTRGAKAQVQQIEQLQEAQQNIIVIEKFNLALEDAEAKLEEVDLENLTKSQLNQFTQLQSSLVTELEGYDSLKLSLIDMAQYENVIGQLYEMIRNEQSDSAFEKVNEINQRIFDLFEQTPQISDGVVVVEELRTTYELSLSELLDEKAEITKEISSLPVKYQPFIFNSLMKQVETDTQRADAVVKKIYKIETVDAMKKKSAANVAYKAYIALTPLQKSLIQEEYELIQEALNEEASENQKVSALVTAIDELLFDGEQTTVYSIESTDLNTLQAEVNALITTYKWLSSAEKKLITNYSNLTVATKNIKAALKVQKAFDAAEALNDSIDVETLKKELSSTKKAITKYKSAISAHSKLTKLQQSLISDMSLNETLATYGNLVASSNNLEVEIQLEKNPESEISVVESTLNAEISALISLDALSYTGTISEFQQRVNQLMNQYKALPSKERKAVYNYSTLTKANSDIKKATNTFTKLNSAVSVADRAKYDVALKAYDKLTALQQSLINLSLLDTTVFDELKGQTDEMKGLIDDMVSAVAEDEVLFEELEELNEEYNKLKKDQKKLVTNYSLLKALVKDMSAVKTFATKVVKLGSNPTLANKDSIITSYYKLTDTQTKLFKYNYSDDDNSAYNNLVKFEQDILNRTKAATDLNKVIEGLAAYTSIFDFNEYVEQLANVEITYNALASADRKLVTDYSEVSRMKRDVNAVLNVIELKNKKELIEAIESTEYKNADKAWQRALNRLNQSQITLYELAN